MAYIGQNEDEWEAAEKKKARKKANNGKETCPICLKKIKSLTGLKTHLRDMHEMKLAPPEPKLRKVVPIVPIEHEGDAGVSKTLDVGSIPTIGTTNLWVDPTSIDIDGFVIGEYENKYINMDVQYVRVDVVEEVLKKVLTPDSETYNMLIRSIKK